MKKQYGFINDKDRLFPPMVIVDITNVCNLSCIHCAHPVIKKDADYEPKFMDIDVFKKIVEEVSKNDILLFRIASDGESLLHPKFFDMLALAKTSGIKPVNLTTNGLCMDEQANKKLAQSGLDIIDISIDAHTEETYEKIRIGGNFNLVKQNVLNLIKVRNDQKSSMKIFVSLIKQPLNEKEVDDFVNFWKPKVDFVMVRNLCDEVGLVAINEDSQKDVPKNRYPCPQLWKRVTINHNGDIRYCVEDWRNKTVMANIMDASIADIWQGKEYQRLRELHLSNKYEGIILCDECKDWVNSPWDYGYDKIIRQTTNAEK